MMEQVLVIKREHFDERLLGQGFIPPSVDSSYTIPWGLAEFIDRDKAENDTTYKQLIPQIVIRNKKDEIFLVQRLKTQGESRLHGKHSIGIGGHINPIDGYDKEDMGRVFRTGLFRELDEEIEFGAVDSGMLEQIGIMNDDSNDVGKVHYAVVYVYTVDDHVHVGIKEKDKMIGGFVSMDEAAKHYDNMENWSKIIFDQIRKE